jgi:hypothetical protein
MRSIEFTDVGLVAIWGLSDFLLAIIFAVYAPALIPAFLRISVVLFTG